MADPAPGLRRTVLDILSPKLALLGMGADEIDGDVSMIELGIVDSFGFLELILAVERETGIQADLADLDPEEFTSIDGLVRYLARAKETA